MEYLTHERNLLFIGSPNNHLNLKMALLKKFGDPNYIMIRALPGNSSYSDTRIFFNDFVAARPSKKLGIYYLHHVIKIAFEFVNKLSFYSDHVLFLGSADR